MTGRALIIYILENNLENEEIFKDGKIVGFISVSEAASKFNVGVGTVKTWVDLGLLDGVYIHDDLYIPTKAALKEV